MGAIGKSLCGQMAEYVSYLGELWQGLTVRNDSLGHLQGEARCTMWPWLKVMLRQPNSPSLSHVLPQSGFWLPVSPDVNADLLPFEWHGTTGVSCMSLKHTIAVLQLSSISGPLLNATLSSAFSSHARPSSPPGPGCRPAAPPGLSLGRVPPCAPRQGSPQAAPESAEGLPLSLPAAPPGALAQMTWAAAVTAAFPQPPLWRRGIPALPRPRCPRERRRPEALPAPRVVLRVNVP